MATEQVDFVELCMIQQNELEYTKDKTNFYKSQCEQWKKRHALLQRSARLESSIYRNVISVLKASYESDIKEYKLKIEELNKQRVSADAEIRKNKRKIMELETKNPISVTPKRYPPSTIAILEACKKARAETPAK